MNGQCSRRNQPAIEAGARDDAFFFQEAGLRLRPSPNDAFSIENACR
jgi:hypothetical protein